MVHVRFQQTFPLRVAEWICGGMMAHWGLIVLTNPEMFERSRAFAGMEHQPIWGAAALALGMLGWVALAINGFWRATPFIRALCAFLRGFLWLTIIIGLALSGEPTTGLAVYPWILALDIWNIYRSASDARSAIA